MKTLLTIGLLSLSTVVMTALPSMARPGLISSEASDQNYGTLAGNAGENPIAQAPSSTPLKIPALQKEMSYEAARQLILKAGWQPLFTTTDNPHDGTQSQRKAGYNEVVSCSGTGMGFCRFEFTGSGNQKLVVVTGGRDSTVQKWWEEQDDRTTDRNKPIKQTKLPFVGKRAFNFLGGSGTGHTITIESNGNTIIQLHGTMSSSTIYQGPFQETMEGITIKDGYADNCAGRSEEEEPEVKRLAPCKAKLYEPTIPGSLRRK